LLIVESIPNIFLIHNQRLLEEVIDPEKGLLVLIPQTPTLRHKQ
jgi:hypothetical protein